MTTQAELFDQIAAKNGVTTFAQPSDNGGWLVWVTANELDPVRALLKAALSILVARGTEVPEGPIRIQKLLVTAPGSEFMWSVHDEAGTILYSGFAANEQEAAQAITDAIGAKKLH